MAHPTAEHAAPPRSSSQAGAALLAGLRALPDPAPSPLRAALNRLALREGTFESAGHTIYYQDAQTLADVAALYAILGEEAATGSPNVENELARAWIEQMQSGVLLDNDQIAKLLVMLKKYAPQLAAFHASSDDSQDILTVPDGNSARILN